MTIHAYSLAWNEEFMMPFFLNHYGKYCEKIVIFDNESSDSTPSIVRSFPNTEIHTWSSNGTINDQMYLDIKNSAYKESRGKADWVIVCDTDELLFHPKLWGVLESYQKNGINYPKVRGYEMMPDRIPARGEDLCSTYQVGARFGNLDTRAIFDPSLDIEYQVGCHAASVSPGAVESEYADIALMHYKMLSEDYFIARHRLLGSRLSQYNRDHKIAGHYEWDRRKMRRVYRGFQRQCQTLVSAQFPPSCDA